ncbi:MAG: hypothetical protein V7K95_01435 [Nostoc sp.]
MQGFDEVCINIFKEAMPSLPDAMIRTSPFASRLVEKGSHCVAVNPAL